MENPGGTDHSGKEVKMKSALRPWEEYLPPFHVCGKLWHVGGKSSPSYLFDTGDGLLLLDTGYPKTAYLLIQNIHELGFDPRKIRWILHSHGHIDHIGATRALIGLTGAKTYIGAGDREIVNGSVDLSWARELNMEFVEPFEPDVLILDGDVLTFGAFTFRCLSTPGHTPGVISYFFELEENGIVYRAGMHGGVGFNSMTGEFLRRYGLSTECRAQFLAGLDRLKREPVDVFVGNHLGNNSSLEKVARREAAPDGPNPFIDPEEWLRFLNSKEADFRRFLEEDDEK